MLAKPEVADGTNAEGVALAKTVVSSLETKIRDVQEQLPAHQGAVRSNRRWKPGPSWPPPTVFTSFPLIWRNP